MRYFELTVDREVSNPVQIQRLDPKQYRNGLTQEEFLSLPSLSVAYFDHTLQVEIYDVLREPAFLVSDDLKHLFALYEPDMEFKAVQLFANDLEDPAAPLFWLPYIPEVDCLSEKSKKYPNGMLEELVLDIHADIKSEIFRVSDIMEYKIIISLAVAESMLRRKMAGFALTPVVFSGGIEKGNEQ